MTTRCKDGDIAIILRDNPGCEANVGRLVEVRGPGSSSCYPGMVTWRIQQIDRHAQWHVCETDASITLEWLTWKSNVSHPDAWLLPIRPRETDEEIPTVTCKPQANVLETTE